MVRTRERIVIAKEKQMNTLVTTEMVLSRLENGVVDKAVVADRHDQALRAAAQNIHVRQLHVLVCNLKEESSAHSAFVSLLRERPDLEEVKLTNCAVDAALLLRLGEFIRVSKSLTSLSLQACPMEENDTNDLVISSLVQDVIASPSLCELDLEQVNIGPEAFRSIINLIYSNAIDTLRIVEGNLRDEHAEEIASVLLRNTSLRTLDLYGNWIGNNGFLALGDALLSNATLRQLNYRNNCGTYESQAKLRIKALLRTRPERAAVMRTILLCGRAHESAMGALPIELLWCIRECMAIASIEGLDVRDVRAVSGGKLILIDPFQIAKREFK